MLLVLCEKIEIFNERLISESYNNDCRIFAKMVLLDFKT